MVTQKAIIRDDRVRRGYVSLKDALTWLDMSLSRIYQIDRSCNLTRVMIGKKRYFLRSELRQVQQVRKAQAKAENQ